MNIKKLFRINQSRNKMGRNQGIHKKVRERWEGFGRTDRRGTSEDLDFMFGFGVL
jgi:hypothetical protein